MTASRLCTTALFLVGFQMVAFGQWPARVLQPDSDIAEALRESLDDVVQLGQIDTNIGQLGNVLSERLDGIPIFVDARGVKMAELSLSDKVQADIKPLPLRSALRSLLAPLGLRAVIQQEGLDITADFTSLTRRGIATDRWVDVDQGSRRSSSRSWTLPFPQHTSKHRSATSSLKSVNQRGYHF